MDWTWIRSTSVFVFMCIAAMISHWFAEAEHDIRFTLLGFLSAVFGGMWYGLNVPRVRYDKW